MIYPLEPLWRRWCELHHDGLIRLALVDIDGCLTPGEASPLDFDLFADLQTVNRRATDDATVPALALCSGRAEPYVELMAQALGCFLPAIWENGAGLYFPVDYRFQLSPLLDAQRLEAFEQARRIVADVLVRPGLARPQPGKEVSISLYPTEQSSLERVEKIARRALEPLADRYWVQGGLTCVEVLPDGIHKGSGARWLLDEVGLVPQQALAIGDGPGDLVFFQVAGLAATPANGAPEVQAAADYVAPREFGQGVLDIINWAIERNQAALDE
jgi:hydroxymethylpyrimidine pyrophosphatase-like HAD family hydrolase